jgi:tetraacyldisaccharide 4'-kinase
LNVLSAAYGGAARLRRSWYERRHARRRLPCPVISVGSLSVGGSGKTPAVIAVTRLLQGAARRPAVLSRGYARRRTEAGVVVVSDLTSVRVPVERSGDEPQMLARALPGVPVLVCDDRYLAGQLAVRSFGCDVLVLDDGFQHVQLARDTDLLLVDPGDLRDEVLPAGRLREPPSSAASADAVLVHGTADEAALAAQALRVERAFHVRTVFGALANVASNEPHMAAPERRVLAVAGIARPERFYHALRASGWQVAGEVTFRDHHWFTRNDVERIVDAVRAASASFVVVTEKDAMRLEALVDGRITWTYLPMELVIEPWKEFSEWLKGRL